MGLIPRVAICGVLAGLLSLAGCEGKPAVAFKELLDEDPEIRADAAIRLGQSKSSEAVDSLIAVLDDPSEVVRVEAIRALGEIGDQRAVPAVAAMAEDPLHTVRLATAQALGKLADPISIPALKDLLYDDDHNVRTMAAYGLSVVPGKESLDILLNLALRDEAEEVREVVIHAIRNHDVRQAIPRLERALRTEADIIRANAAMVMGDVADSSSITALIQALEDPFFKVRSLAAESLYKIASRAQAAPDTRRVLEALHKRLDVEDHGMTRVDLAWNLARLGDRSRMDVARDLLLRGQPEDVRAEAARALGDVGDAGDIPLLRKATNDKKGLVRREARRSIDKLEKA